MSSGIATYGGPGIAARALRLAAVLLLVGTVAGCDQLDQVLAVELPGNVVAEDLENPELAQTLVNSVISDLECAWSEYASASAHHSDEYIQSSGNLWFRNWGQRRTLADDSRFGQSTCSSTYAFYTPLHTARFQAQTIYQRLNSDAFADVPDRQDKLATVRAFGAYALVGLGEGFCEMTVPEEGQPGPLLEPDSVLRIAETRFTEAINLAGDAGNDDIRNMALVGRARVRLDLENFQGVIDDASQIPAGYLKVATRDNSESRRENHLYEAANEYDDTPHASVADNFRNLTIDADGRPTEGDGVEDPRVNVTTGLCGGETCLGHNNVTVAWYHDKIPSNSTPVPIASYKEARLFLAEAYVRSGDPEEARTIINDRRTELALPTFDEPADDAEMLDLVIEERRRELFVEGGHRLNDMLRFRDTDHEIPFLGEEGSIHPDGLDNIGATYGDMTCYPLPTVERIGNPNIST